MSNLEILETVIDIFSGHRSMPKEDLVRGVATQLNYRPQRVERELKGCYAVGVITGNRESFDSATYIQLGAPWSTLPPAEQEARVVALLKLGAYRPHNLRTSLEELGSCLGVRPSHGQTQNYQTQTQLLELLGRMKREERINVRIDGRTVVSLGLRLGHTPSHPSSGSLTSPRTSPSRPSALRLSPPQRINRRPLQVLASPPVTDELVQKLIAWLKKQSEGCVRARAGETVIHQISTALSISPKTVQGLIGVAQRWETVVVVLDGTSYQRVGLVSLDSKVTDVMLPALPRRQVLLESCVTAAKKQLREIELRLDAITQRPDAEPDQMAMLEQVNHLARALQALFGTLNDQQNTA